MSIIENKSKEIRYSLLGVLSKYRIKKNFFFWLIIINKDFNVILNVNKWF